MDNRPVLFIDSGIGGLIYCRDFLKKNPQEEVCYLADRQNFPYGQKKKEELESILFSLTEKLLKTINPKIVVIACNTATITALNSLRQAFTHIPFVGTVPAIKPAINASKTGKIGVIGTTRTIEGCELQDNNEYKICAVASPDLVEFVELHFDKSDKNKKQEIVKKYIDIFRSEGVDTIVLGCTHFLYLLEEFKKEAYPSIQIFESLDGITKRIEYLLYENNGALRAEVDFQPVNWLLLTGSQPVDSSWQERANSLGFALCILEPDNYAKRT